jgi:hypothetical protein
LIPIKRTAAPMRLDSPRVARLTCRRAGRVAIREPLLHPGVVEAGEPIRR